MNHIRVTLQANPCHLHTPVRTIDFETRKCIKKRKSISRSPRRNPPKNRYNFRNHVVSQKGFLCDDAVTMWEVPKNFEEIKSQKEEMYKNVTPVIGPYLQKEVAFDSRGLEHLKFKRRGHARSIQDQYMRFKLLHLAPEVLKLSRTVQGIFLGKHFERVRMHSRTEERLVPVTYYEFIAVLGEYRVKVIIKEIDGGQPFFWSLIPYWRIDTSTKRRRLHAGDPEND